VSSHHPSKVTKDPGTRGRLGGAAHLASGGSIGTEGAADLRRAPRRFLLLRALDHIRYWKTSPAHAPKPRDVRYLDRGTTRWYARAPAS
jgi:hypothetical protein